MSNLLLRHAVITLPLLGTAMTVWGAEDAKPDALSADVGVRHTWDSNYDREADGNDERITVAYAGAEVNTDISRQHFSGRIGVARYIHDRRDYLDATGYNGGLAWRGEQGDTFRTLVSWSRKDRPADRIDFIGNDIITYDDKQATLVYVMNTSWEIPLTVREAEQTHDNDSRRTLDYTDKELFTGVRYRSGRNSTVMLRLVNGEREYPNQATPIPAGQDLNFDYQRAEVETNWAFSKKTRLTGVVGYFQRDGEVNDGNGLQALLEGNWQASSKTLLTLGYNYDQPPLGEDSENASDTQRVYIGAEWDATPKLSVKTGAKQVWQSFDNTLQTSARDETVNVVTPLIVAYQFTDVVGVDLVSAWQKRHSPIASRDYSATELTLELKAEF